MALTSASSSVRQVRVGSAVSGKVGRLSGSCSQRGPRAYLGGSRGIAPWAHPVEVSEPTGVWGTAVPGPHPALHTLGTQPAPGDQTSPSCSAPDGRGPGRSWKPLTRDTGNQIEPPAPGPFLSHTLPSSGPLAGSLGHICLALTFSVGDAEQPWWPGHSPQVPGGGGLELGELPAARCPLPAA